MKVLLAIGAIAVFASVMGLTSSTRANATPGPCGYHEEYDSNGGKWAAWTNCSNEWRKVEWFNTDTQLTRWMCVGPDAARLLDPVRVTRNAHDAGNKCY